MTSVWLIPVQWDGSAALLGPQRLLLEPDDRRERFLNSLRGAHSRLLLPFKAAMLLGDGAADACAANALPFALGNGNIIRLAVERHIQETGDRDVPVWPLSHCAEAYFNRLLPPGEAADLLLTVPIEPEAWAWRQSMLGWLKQGWQVILLREDAGL